MTNDTFCIGGRFDAAGGFNIANFAAFQNLDGLEPTSTPTSTPTLTLTPSASATPTPSLIPSINFSTPSSNGSESNSSVNLPLTLLGTYASNVTVNYSITGGTSIGGGVDYTLASGTATVTAGQLTTNIPLTIVQDMVNEPAETIIVTISNPINATLGGTTTHTYTINYNSIGAGISFEGSPLNSNVTEGSANNFYSIALTSQPNSDVTINLNPDLQLTTSESSVDITDNDSAGVSVVQSGGSTTVSEAM